MKKYLFLILFACALCWNIMPSAAQSCCSKDNGWVAMASSGPFISAHDAPEPFAFVPEGGSMIRFHTKDAGKDGQAYYVPSDKATNVVLVIFHEWWGLNDYMKQEAERWQKMLGNVDVYAVDLYDGMVAATPEEASKIAKSLDARRGQHIIEGLISKIGQDKQIATLGWCMGGSWSFTAALLAGDQAAACVMYYGFPEQDEQKVKTIQCDVLYMWASRDNFITRDVVQTFKQQVEATNHRFDLHVFDAVHAFANPSNPHHDPKATEEAQVLTLKFLKERLRLN